MLTAEFSEKVQLIGGGDEVPAGWSVKAIDLLDEPRQLQFIQADLDLDARCPPRAAYPSGMLLVFWRRGLKCSVRSPSSMPPKAATGRSA